MSRKWTYSYKTSDGAWHEDLLEADNRDAAYAAIREKGIRPVKISERIQPVVRRGFRGLRRRDWLLMLLASIAVAVVVAVVLYALALSKRTSPASAKTGVVATARARHQIEFIPNDFPHRLYSAFKFNSERFLALYAQPGMPRRMLDGGKWMPSLYENPPRAIEFSLNDLSDALASDILIFDDDPRWLADLKRVVVGMKEEAGTLFRSGKGADEIALWLDERNKMESSYREATIRKVKADELSRESANNVLKTMGLKGVDEFY